MTPVRKRGLFITFEGGEGCGKSTQLNLLKAYLESKGHEVLATREPGGTPLAESIRGLLLDSGNEGLAPRTELLLYVAARAQHVKERIRPALETGKIVLCDRYADSTTAYQGAGREIDRETLRLLHEVGTEGLDPDLTILLDVPAQVGLGRYKPKTKKRKQRQTHQMDIFDTDRIERESIDFHERVHTEFMRIANEEPERVKRVDGTGSIDEVATAVRVHVDLLLGEG